METFFEKLSLALLALSALILAIAADNIRLRIIQYRRTRHKLTISISLFWTTTIVFSRTYRYQWLAVLAAWWHGHNLRNMRPMKVITTIERIHA